jgi:hypothetical protein
MKESENILPPAQNVEASSLQAATDIVSASEYKAPELPDAVFVLLTKIMGVKNVVGTLLLLSRRINKIVKGENYILFKHFLRTFNLLNDRMKRTDLPSRGPVLDFLRDNWRLCREVQPVKLEPFSYYTDGGTYNDDSKYFINNIFSRTNICHSTRLSQNANVQIYLGRLVDTDPSVMPPTSHKVPGSKNGHEILLPYEKHFRDQDEEETFKLLGNIELHNMGSGYTCFVRAFCFFASDREIKISKSPVIKFFESINTVEAFEALRLPVKKRT